jgi:tetratricopeptide (TPR) repeat protein
MEQHAGTKAQLGGCAYEQAQCLHDLGRDDEAKPLADEAVALIGDEALVPRARALGVAGQVSAGLGDVREAERLLREAAVTLAASGAGREAAQQWAELAEQFDAMGHPESARDAYRAAAACAGLILDTTAATRFVAALGR